MSITSKDWEMCGCRRVLPERGRAGGRAAGGRRQSYCRGGGTILW